MEVPFLMEILQTSTGAAVHLRLKLAFESALPDEAAVICGPVDVLCSTPTNGALNG